MEKTRKGWLRKHWIMASFIFLLIIGIGIAIANSFKVPENQDNSVPENSSTNVKSQDNVMIAGPEGIQGKKGDKGDRGETGPGGPVGPAGFSGKDGKDWNNMTEEEYHCLVVSMDGTWCDFNDQGYCRYDGFRKCMEESSP